MRDSLTVLAILLIGVLSAALVGPYVVDWDSHRALIERRLSEGLGTPVTVAGPIDVKLLPTPRFRFGGVAVGDAKGGRPRLSAAALQTELSFTALLRGQVQVVETTWESPRLDLSQAADGTVDLALPSGRAADRVAVDHLAVRDGTLVLSLADGRRRTLTGIDLNGEAASLRGPFKASGTVGAVPFRLATGALDRGALRVKLHLDGEGQRPGLDLDGTASTALAFEGTASLSGALPVEGSPATIPWQLAGHVAATRDAAQASDVVLRAGNDMRALIADGEGNAAYGAAGSPPAAVLKLHGASLDLDRLAVAPDKGSIAPPRGTDLVAGWLRLAGEGGGASALPARLDVSARFDTATLGGQTLLATRFGLGLGPAPQVAFALAVEGPQGARLSLDGEVDPGPARPVAGPFGAAPAPGSALFRGTFELRSGDIRRTAAWLTPLAPRLGASLAAVPGRSVAASGEVEASRAGLVARNLRFGLDGSTFAGLVSVTQAVGAERARLFADLTSEALALDRVPDLSGAAAASRDLDLDLALSALAVTVADPTPDAAAGRIAPIAAGHVALHLTRTGDDLRLDRLALDIDGAALAGTASRIAGEARADLHVSAPHLGPLAAAFGPLLPADVAGLLRERAGVLSPLDAALTFDGDVGPDDALRPKRFALVGRVGGSRLDAALAPEPGADGGAVTLRAEAEDGADLLRQLGLPAATAPLGPARLAVAGRGSPDQGYAGTASGGVAGVDFSFDGRGRPALGGGRLALRSGDLRPLLAAIGGAGGGAAMPGEASGDLGWESGRLAWRGLAAHLAGAAANGSLTLDLPRGRGAPALGGDLSVDRIPVSALLALGLGLPGAPVPGDVWSSAPFAAPPALLPAGTVAMRVGSMPLADGLEARDVGFSLVLQGHAVTLADAKGRLGTGTIGGSLTLRRDAGGETLSGRAEWADVALDLGGLSGRVGGRQDFAATGRSPAALVASLAGTGTVTLKGAVLAQTDPVAPGLTLAAVAARDTAAERSSGGTDVTPTDAEALRRDLSLRLAAAPLRLGDASVATTLAGGVVRTAPLRAAAPAGAVPPWSAETAATVDLVGSTLATRTTLRDPGGGEVAVMRSGPFRGEPRLVVDATSLVGAVQAQAIARAQERIDIMEQDIRERAAFNRQLKAILADQRAARDRAEADRKAAAEALKAAADERRAAAEARRVEAARQKAEDARIQADVEAAARRDRRPSRDDPASRSDSDEAGRSPPP